jgi:membrane-bound ClpP family serine protease
MNSVFKFLASSTGRIVRIVVGVALVLVGFFGLPNNLNWLGIILIIVGLVPLLAGAFDVCVFAPLFGKPLSGKKIRAG